jgi:surface antigen
MGLHPFISDILICKFQLRINNFMYSLWRVRPMLILAHFYLLSGCVNTGGYPNSNLAGSTYDPMSAVSGALLNSVSQNMAASVMNGQIGSFLAPQDQNFRLQQLGNLVQSGTVNQAQQWVNPQTGSSLAVNPIGQNQVHPQTQQQCQNLQEVVTMPDGKTITETRQACLDPNTGSWSLVQ